MQRGFVQELPDGGKEAGKRDLATGGETLLIKAQSSMAQGQDSWHLPGPKMRKSQWGALPSCRPCHLPECCQRKGGKRGVKKGPACLEKKRLGTKDVGAVVKQEFALGGGERSQVLRSAYHDHRPWARCHTKPTLLKGRKIKKVVATANPCLSLSQNRGAIGENRENVGGRERAGTTLKVLKPAL